MVSWPSWLRHRANNAGISGSIPLETIYFFISLSLIFVSQCIITARFWSISVSIQIASKSGDVLGMLAFLIRES